MDDNFKKDIGNIISTCYESISIDKSFISYNLNKGYDCVIIAYKDEQVVGFSLIAKNSIALLCVTPEMRSQGIGSTLLYKSESIIRNNNCNKIILGNSNYFFQGVLRYSDDSHKFFKNRGYKASWTSIDMTLPMKNYHVDSVPNKYPDNIEFKYIEHNCTQLLDAVNKVEPKWINYYKNTINDIIVAMKQEEIIGFAVVSSDSISIDKNDIASIGCVGVIPDAREKGIGLNMVAYALSELKNKGCKECYIKYTWLEEWYGKLGFRVKYRFWMGEKK